MRDIQKMKIKIFLSTLLLSFQALIAEPTLEDQVKAAKNPDYFIHKRRPVQAVCLIFPGAFFALFRKEQAKYK